MSSEAVVNMDIKVINKEKACKVLINGETTTIVPQP